MKQTVYILILSLALVTCVTAQKGFTKTTKNANTKRTSSVISKLQKYSASLSEDQVVFSFSGVQSAEAVYDVMNDRYRENTYVLNGGLDQFTTHLTISLDYSIDPMDPSRCVIAGGKWSMVVYDTNVYMGVIYGEISTGEIIYSVSEVPTIAKASAASREMTAEFRIMGGTDEFADLTPEAMTQPFTASASDGPGGSVLTTATLGF